MKASILTISDRCFKNLMTDESGKVMCDILQANGFEIKTYEIIPDDKKIIEKKLTEYADELKVNFVFTTGGTGISPRDVTPEATLAISDKLIPGLSEYIRREGLKYTKSSALSRQVSVIRKNSIIINLPGNPKAVKESLNAILDILPHALDMLKGKGHI